MEDKKEEYTFAMVWQSLMEGRKQQQETEKFLSEKIAETDRVLSEKIANLTASQKETDRVLKEKSAETEKILSEKMAETDRVLKEKSAETEKFLSEKIADLTASQQETDRVLKEKSAETAKFLSEQIAETDRVLSEKMAELTDAQIKSSAEFEKRMDALRQETGGIGQSNGAMAEEAIYNVLKKDMKFCKIKFDDITPNPKRESVELNIGVELDVMLKNGNTIALIETKYKVRKKDVSDLATIKLTKFKTLFKEYSDYKIILGVGGMSFEKDAEEEAKDNGIGIIKVVGEKVEFYTEDIKFYKWL